MSASTKAVLSQDLLPCPFCGGDASKNAHSTGCYFTKLQVFIAHGQANKADLSAVPELMAAWNSRASLRAALAEGNSSNNSSSSDDPSPAALRAAVIEKCARIVQVSASAGHAAAAIRALKEK